MNFILIKLVTWNSKFRPLVVVCLSLFESDKSVKVLSAKADNSDKLYEQIGRLQVENTLLKKSYREL